MLRAAHLAGGSSPCSSAARRGTAPASQMEEQAAASCAPSRIIAPAACAWATAGSCLCVVGITERGVTACRHRSQNGVSSGFIFSDAPNGRS